MILERFTKQPFDRKDYGIDYSPWLTDGDTLNDVSVEITCTTNESDDSLVAEAQITETRIVLWVSGGADKHKYKVEIDVETVMGRREQIELIFTVKDV